MMPAKWERDPGERSDESGSYYVETDYGEGSPTFGQQRKVRIGGASEEYNPAIETTAKKVIGATVDPSTNSTTIVYDDGSSETRSAKRDAITSPVAAAQQKLASEGVKPSPPKLVQVGGGEPAKRILPRGEDKGMSPAEQNYATLLDLKYNIEANKRATPGKMVEAKNVPDSWRIDKPAGPSIKTAEALDQANQASARAQLAAAARDEAEQKTLAGIQEQYALDQQAQLDAERERRAKIDDRINMMLQDQQTTVDAIKNFKIQHPFEEKPWRAVLASIAMLVGAFGNDPTATANIIQKSIDTHIDLQRDKLAKLKAYGAEQKSLLGQLIQAYGSPEAAELAMRERATVAAQAKIQAMAAKAHSPGAESRLMATAAALEQDVLKNRAQLETAIGSNVTTAIRHVPEHYVPGSGGPNIDNLLKIAKERADIDAARSGRTDQESLRDAQHRIVVLPDNLPENERTAYAARQTDARDLQQIINSAYNVNGYMERLKQAIRERGKLPPGAKARRALNREIFDLANSIQPEIQRINNTGQSLTQNELQAIEPFKGTKLLQWQSLTRDTEDMVNDIQRAQNIIGSRYNGAVNSLFRDPWGEQLYRPDVNAPLVSE